MSGINSVSHEGSILSRSVRRLMLVASCTALFSVTTAAQVGPAEKDELTFGFIKLTDMAPLAIAYEQGYFEDEGLYATIQA